MNKLVERKAYPVAVSNEAQRQVDNITRAASEDAGFDRMMKFRKGHFYSGEEEIEIGTTMIAHCRAWTKCWLKWKDDKVVERRVYRMVDGEAPALREDLDDTDPAKWPLSKINNQPQDPWQMQYMIPLETNAGDVFIFTTSSFGGRRAVADVCAAWGRKMVRDPNSGQPIIRLREVMMPSKRFGEVPRPQFEIVGWDGTHEAITEVQPENLKHDDMNDDIPF